MTDRDNGKEKDMNELVEMETVKLQIPKSMMNCLRELEHHIGQSVNEYLEYSLIDIFSSDLNSKHIFTPDIPALIKKYNLQELNTLVRGAIPKR